LWSRVRQLSPPHSNLFFIKLSKTPLFIFSPVKEREVARGACGIIASFLQITSPSYLFPRPPLRRILYAGRHQTRPILDG